MDANNTHKVTIYLYETAGRLVIGPDPRTGCYADVTDVADNFYADAVDMACGYAGEWPVNWYPPAYRVAQWQEETDEITVLDERMPESRSPGPAAREYLGLDGQRQGG